MEKGESSKKRVGATSDHVSSAPPDYRPTRFIPGPAGDMQRAWQMMAIGKDVEPITTQQCIHRNLTEAQYDDDFDKKPWETAKDYGYLDMEEKMDIALLLKTPYFVGLRAPLIVALVKTCTPDGEGGASVKLKDESGGIIDAAIHYKAFSEGKFAGMIKVGSCLVINNSAVFGPCPAMYCPYILNVVNANLEYVIGV